MQLDQLEFVVKTEQLDTAITKIRKLGEEVSKLPKGGLGGLPTGGGTRGAGRDVEDYEKKLEKLREQLKFLRNDQELTNLGFTKTQAGMLAAIKVAGAGEKTIASFAIEFDKLNKITGQNPFDKSSQGLKKLENDLREIEEVTKYTAQGFKLTSDQVKALSRDLEAMRQRNEALNVSDQEISRLQKEHILLFAQKAEQLNKYNAEAARSTAAAKTLANADAKLLEQEQKLAFTNKQLADGLSQGSANALYNYKKQIEALGLSTEQAAKRVASFREQLLIKQGYSPLTKLSKDTEETSKKLDHLSRALGPQITDIFVGLATGQSLLTVALQQGGQIRDQIALSGIASAEAGKAMSLAATKMVASLKDTSTAIGSLLITPFIAGGKAVTDFATKILFANKTIQSYSLAIAMYADNGNKLASGLVNAMSKIPMLIGASFAAVTVAITTLTVAFFVAQKELDNLSKQLVLTGGSLGLNKDLALDYAKSLDGVSGSTSQVIAVIQAMAKEGGFLKEEISLVTKSAVDLEKYAGVSIEDTVKAFAKMKEEPVKALLELAKQTGMVSAETLNMVVALEKQGNTSQAAAVAIKALADVHSEQVDRMKRDYSTLGLALIGAGDAVASVWRNIKGIAYQPTDMEKAIKELQKADVFLTRAEEKLNSPKELFDLTPNPKVIDNLRKKLDARKAEYVQLVLNQQAENQSTINNVAIADAKKRGLDLEASAMSSIEKSKANITKYTGEIAKAEQLVASTKDDQVIKDTLISNLKKSIAKENENIAKETKKNNADQLSEAKKIENFGKKALEESRKYLAGERAEVEQTTEAWKKYLKLQEADEWAKQSEELKEQIRLNYQLADAEERMREQRTKSQEEFMKNFGEIARLNSETYRKNTVSIQQAKEEAESIKYQASLIGLSSDEREKLLALKKIDLQTEKDINELVSKGIPLNATVIQQTRDLGQLQKDNVQAMLDLKQYEKLMSELGDVMFLALTNRGAQAGKKLRDLIKAELRERISVVINATVNAIFGDAINSLLAMVGVKVPGTDSSTGSLSSAAGLYKTGSDVYSAATGGFAKVGTAASALTERFATSALGQKLGLSSVQSVNVPVFEAGASSTSGTTMVSNDAVNQTVMTESGQSLTTSVGNIATSVAATIVGQALRKAISGGYKMNKGLEKVADIAAIAAGFSGNPFAQIVVGVVSGLASRAFGTKLTQTGIQGTFGGKQGFTGSRYTFEEGGWFREDKERLQPLEQELQSGLALAFNVTKFEVQKFTDYMGIGADAIANYSTYMKLNLQGLSEADALKAIDAEFAKVKESMAAAVLAGKSYGKANETSYQTLERLATTVYSVNSIFKDLGANVLASGYAGIDAALMFAEYFGGIDKFNSALSKFYNEFYTDAEKTTNLTRNTTDAFKALGLELPTSRDAFKELVKSAINAGDPQLLTSLLGLQDAFILLTEPAEKLKETVKQLTDSLIEEVKRLRGAVVSDVSLSGGIPGLTAEFAILTAQAKLGNTTALEKLPEYSQAIEQAVAASAVNASDVVYARAWLAESLGNTNAVLTGTSPNIVSSSLTQDVASTTTVNGATAIVASSSSQSDLIAALVAEVQGLRAEVRADVSANSKTARILERANQDGETLSVSVV